MIRLILLIILLLLSLLTIFRAFEFHLWLAAIVVTEFSWLFTIITVLLIALWPLSSRFQLAGTITGLLALILFISPIVRAMRLSSSLAANLGTAFGESPGNHPAKPGAAPFRFSRLFRNSAKYLVPYDRHTYVTYPDTALTLDFYPSAYKGESPCVIVIHGGSWKSGDSAQLPELNSYLAGAGYHVAAINYRLAPGYLSPAPVADVRAAIAYLKQHAKELMIDTARLVILGRSAGAQIGLLAAYTTHDPAIRGVIDFYGPADMVWGYSLPSNPLIMDSRKVMRDYLGGSYDEVPGNFEASSPLIAARSYAVPTLIIHGGIDVLVSPVHSRRLDSLLSAKRVPHYYLAMPWATHGFDYSINGPSGQLSTFAVERFLQAVCK